MPSGDKFRLLLLADPTLDSSTALLRAALEAAAPRRDVEIVGVVDTARRPHAPLRAAKALGARVVKRAFTPRSPVGLGHRPRSTPAALARSHDVPLLAPDEPGLNDPRFVEHIGSVVRPDGALALMVSQIFGAPLLAACGTPANYHDGLLPAYRGVGATAWSVFRGDETSGFTYHRMTPGVDEGPILLQDAVPVPAEASTREVERAKTELAAARIDRAIDLIVAEHPGDAQLGTATTYSRADMAAVRTIRDPSALTWDEIRRRLLAFELLDIGLAGRRWAVTALSRAGRRPRSADLAFRTADGVVAEPTRCKHLPVPLYRAYASLR
jgi:hypothetical protein